MDKKRCPKVQDFNQIPNAIYLRQIDLTKIAPEIVSAYNSTEDLRADPLIKRSPECDLSNQANQDQINETPAKNQDQVPTKKQSRNEKFKEYMSGAA
jgi:hypothetical protein